MKSLILIGLLIILIIITSGCTNLTKPKEPPLGDGESPIQSVGYEYCNNHHGTSTNGTCLIETDCVTDGCNGEICRSKSEEGMVSICVYDPPYPKDLGCSCKCINNKCMWVK